MRLMAALVFLLVGCSTPLRAPLCQPGESQMPPGSSGRYRFISFGADIRYSDAYAGIEETYVTIKEQPHGTEVWAKRGSVARVRKAFKASTPATGDIPFELMAGYTVCKIGDAYYLQQEQDDGTYTVARFDLSESQITATPLVFVYDELVKGGFHGVFVPKFSDYEDAQKEWRFDMTQKTRLFVDNSNLAPGDREKLMTLAHPMPTGMVLTRVGPAPARRRADEALVFRTGTP